MRFFLKDLNLRILTKIEQHSVWDHWFKIENRDRYDSLSGKMLQAEIEEWRTDIKSCLPNDLHWYEAEIDEEDLNHIYIISSYDWSEISKKTFLALKVSENLNMCNQNADSIRISEDIKRKISFWESGCRFDTKFIAVAHNNKGPFTLIEGNRRAVALIHLNCLVGKTIFLGVSDLVINSTWTTRTYSL